MQLNDDLAKELEATEAAKKLDEQKTAMKKSQFISELKNGLGAEIKANPSGIKIIKKTRGERFYAFLKKIFTKF